MKKGGCVPLKLCVTAPAQDGELKLWRHILTSTNVSLTPGLSLHCPEPGWYRVCFAREVSCMRKGDLVVRRSGRTRFSPCRLRVLSV